MARRLKLFQSSPRLTCFATHQGRRPLAQGVYRAIFARGLFPHAVYLCTRRPISRAARDVVFRVCTGHTRDLRVSRSYAFGIAHRYRLFGEVTFSGCIGGVRARGSWRVFQLHAALATGPGVASKKRTAPAKGGGKGFCLEPAVGFEPTTYRLRGGCSTAELHRPARALLSIERPALTVHKKSPPAGGGPLVGPAGLEPATNRL